MRVFFPLLLLVLLSFSCSKENVTEAPTSNCPSVIIDEPAYNDLSFFLADVLEVSFDGFCMNVKLGVGGCDTDQEIDMLTNGNYFYSSPAGIEVDFRVNEPQPCNAYFPIEKTYDISSLLPQDVTEFVFFFRGQDITITYTL